MLQSSGLVLQDYGAEESQDYGAEYICQSNRNGAKIANLGFICGAKYAKTAIECGAKVALDLTAKRENDILVSEIQGSCASC